MDNSVDRESWRSGTIGEGKTTYIQKITQILKQENISFTGIYSEKISEGNKTIGYNVVDIKNKSKEKFLRLQGEEQFEFCRNIQSKVRSSGGVDNFV